MRRYCPACDTRDICRTFGGCYLTEAKKRRPRIRATRVRNLHSCAPPLNISPEAQAERDERYAERCNTLGGFPIAVVTYGRTWWKNAAGEVWRASQ